VSFDRAKTLESAEMHLAKGQLDAAISDYERLVQAEPKDPRLALKLGDLYMHQGAEHEASTTYRKVAEQYVEQGFFLKAVTVFQQILRIDPSQLDVWEQLAGVYEQSSLKSDAVTTYQQIADLCARSNNPRRAIQALERATELDPQNIAACVHYAEALSKVHRIDDAVHALRQAAAMLKSQGYLDDYIKVGERLLFHQPTDHAFARELASAYLAINETRLALVKLQGCFNADPKHIDTLLLLVRAFEQLGQPAKTVSVLKEIARLYGQQQRIAEQAGVLKRIVAIDPGDMAARRELSGLKLLVPDAAVDGGGAQSAKTDDGYDLLLEDDESNLVEESSLPQAQLTLQAQVKATVARLLDECAVFIRYGLTDKIISQLQEVLRLDPENIDARELLKEAFVKVRRPADAIEQLIALAEQLAPIDTDKAQAYLSEAAHIDPQSERVKQAQGAWLLEASPHAHTMQEAPAESESSPCAHTVAPEEAEDSSTPVELEESDVVFVDEAPHASSDDEPEPEALSDVLEEVEFYTAQGMTEEALFTLNEALASFPGHPLLLSRLSALNGSSEKTPEQKQPTQPLTQAAAADESQTAKQAPAAEAIAAASEQPLAPEPSPNSGAQPPQNTLALSEPESAAEQNADSSAQPSEDNTTLSDLEPGAERIEPEPEPNVEAETELDAAFAPVFAAAPALDAPPSHEDDSFELAQRLSEELAPPMTNGTTMAVAEVLSQFKQGVAEHVDATDVATHYDLGIAYMEMGLHNEAIDEFKLCVEDPERSCTAHTMVGLSHIANSDIQQGIEHLELALGENPKPAEELGLWFELGNAYELLGKNAEALAWYEQVHARDAQFRDVAERVDRLAVIRAPEQAADEFDTMFDSMILKD